jgi:hypothetical protein
MRWEDTHQDRSVGYRMDLMDAQWAVIERLIAEQERTPRGPGRPWRDAQAIEQTPCACRGPIFIAYIRAAAAVSVQIV